MAKYASVWIKVDLMHLDRYFDYLVPDELAEQVQVGSLVEVIFAGQKKTGVVVALPETVVGDLRYKPIEKLISPLPLLDPDIISLSEKIAYRWINLRSEVLDFALPPRMVRTEKKILAAKSKLFVPAALPSEFPFPTWQLIDQGSEFLGSLTDGKPARALINPAGSGANACRLSGLTAENAPEIGDVPWWALLYAQAAYAACRGGKACLLLVPSDREVEIIRAAVELFLSSEFIAILTSKQLPSKRYEAYLQALTGSAQVVIGTRGAALAPVKNLGLIAIWDEANELYNQPRRPFFHARDVLALRSKEQNTAFLVGGYAFSAVASGWVKSKWVASLSWDRRVRQDLLPHLAALDDYDAQKEGATGYTRLPSTAWRLVKRALEQGPVLIQVPRSGYTNRVRCAECGHIASCASCGGGLKADETGQISCAWCGKERSDWACECGNKTWRAAAVGAERTLQELSKAFPRVPILAATARGYREPLTVVDKTPRLVVATVGAEPAAEGGYTAAVLLDANLLLGLGHLDTPLEALRRWLGAANLVRSHRDGGQVLLTGNPPINIAQAFIRYDALGYGQEVLAERVQTSLPPSSHLLAIDASQMVAAQIAGFLRGQNGLDGWAKKSVLVQTDKQQQAELFSFAAVSDGQEKSPESTAEAENSPAQIFAWLKEAEILGPVKIDDYSSINTRRNIDFSWRLIVRIPHRRGQELYELGRYIRTQSSLQRLTVRVEIDPADFG